MKVDTHCHLSKKEYENLDVIINHMKNDIIICSGASMEDNISTLELISQYDNIYGTIGFHPDEIHNIDKGALEYLEKNLSNKKIVGIGEIGLDYYHSDEKELQKDLFKSQLDIARKYNLPVVIHSREAGQDTYDILKSYKDLKKIMHCYSYSLEMAEEFIKIGCKLGIGGVLTFKNEKKLKNIVENFSLDNFVLETDSPYLTPEPFRGHQNEPYNITYVANKIAEIKNISVEKVYEITTKNACEIYDIKI